MKKNDCFVAILSLFIMAVAVSAQTRAAADFSGTWNLDVKKSKLSDRQKEYIGSRTLTITQTGTDIKTDPSTKRPGGGAFEGDIPMTIPLGKENTVNLPGGPGGSDAVTLSSKWDGSKLVVSIVRTLSGAFEGTSSRKDTYELGADGKSLTVKQENSNSMGQSDTSTFFYTKGG